MQGRLYSAIFKRTSTFLLAITAGAFLFERTYDLACDTMFENINKGKLWKDIKPAEE